MTKRERSAAGVRPLDGPLVLASTTWVQAVTSAAMLLMPTIAPQVAAGLGVPTGLVGVQISLLYGVAMATSMVAGVIVQRSGACRTSQYAMAFVAAGCAMALIPSLAALLVTTLFLGVAYGLTNPAASNLLARFTAPERRNLVYSVKQTGVPLGGILAGLSAPPVAEGFGWQGAFALAAAVAGVTGLALQPVRAGWDRDRDSKVRLRALGSLGLLQRRRGVLWLGFTGFFFAAAQLCVLSYFVTMMVEELLIGLVTAGAIMSIVHASGVAGRIGWGMAADRLGRAMTVLYILGVTMAALFAVVTLLAPGWPLGLTIGLFLLVGATAIGWNGVYMAEVARRNPPEEIGEATAGVLVFTYMGVLLGPALFALVQSLTGAYAATFALAFAFALGGIACLAMADRNPRGTD